MALIRLAIAGCGRIAAGIHLPNLRRMAGVQVTAVADPDAAARKRALEYAPAAHAADDWTGIVERDDVDAVLVALPSALNAEAAQAVLKAGRHLYLEKPIASTVRDARRVRDAARHSSVVAMVGFNYRFNPLFEKLRDVARDRSIGDLIAVRTVFSTHGLTRDWRADPALGGGVLLDLASHHADLVPHITGRRIRSVFARVTSRIHEGDTAAITLELENDVVAHSLFTTAGPEQDSVELTGELGTATVRRYESLAIERRGRKAAAARRDQLSNLVHAVAAAPYLRVKRRAPGHEPSYRIALDRFVHAVRTGGTASPGIEDGLRAAAVIDAAIASAASGCAVSTEHEPGTDAGTGEPTLA